MIPRRLLPLVIGTAFAALLIPWAVARLTPSSDIPLLDLSSHTERRDEDAVVGICPWRDPDADLKRFFPNATTTQTDTVILTRQKPQIETQLGRRLTGEETALQVHRVLQEQKLLGTVLTRRLRGESGVIELMLAVGEDGKVLGAKLQRLREPDDAAAFLTSDAFLGAFRGRSAASSWELGKGFPAIPATAQVSAKAVLDGAHTALVLLQVGNTLRK